MSLLLVLNTFPHYFGASIVEFEQKHPSWEKALIKRGHRQKSKNSFQNCWEKFFGNPWKKVYNETINVI